VNIITFAQHTRHIFQVLDLSLLDMLNRHGQYRLPFGDEKGTAQFIKRMRHDLRLTMIDMNRRGAFQEIGRTFVVIDGVQCVVFNEMTLRKNRGFKKLSAIGFSLDDLPARRRRAEFEWINKSV
jgi:hypothetical protein